MEPALLAVAAASLAALLPAAAAPAAGAGYLWVPEQMIAGEYYGAAAAWTSPSSAAPGGTGAGGHGGRGLECGRPCHCF